MCAKILKSNGQYAYRSSWIPVTADEMRKPSLRKEMREFNKSAGKVLGAPFKEEDLKEEITPDYEPYYSGDPNEPPLIVPDRDDYDAEAFDPFLHAEVLLPFQGTQQMAKVTARRKDPEGNLIGKAAAHPILDTREYVVEFPDGSEAEYAANIIAKNLLSQCDSEGWQHLLVKHIVDHLKGESAIEKADAYLTVNDRQVRKKTTKETLRGME
jgi:hypothetical protein